MKIGEVYANKGELVTCENGHDVFVFADTVFVGCSSKGTEFAAFVDGQKKPMIGTPILRCLCHCGARYAGGKDCHYYDANVYHFSEGWRSCQ